MPSANHRSEGRPAPPRSGTHGEGACSVTSWDNDDDIKRPRHVLRLAQS
jgi:hypothetical protein